MDQPRINSGSIVLRLLVVGVLVLLLLIPTGMISALVGERERRKQEAVTEVKSKWARAQTLAGPIVTVPYEKKWRDADGKTQSSLEHLTFLPQTLEIAAALEPHTRYRGIYQAVLYSAKISARGQFSFTNLGDLGVVPENIRWQDAFVSLGIPDMRGIKEYIRLTWNGRTYVFAPGIREGGDLLDSGISVKVPLSADRAADRTAAFSFALDLNGSEELNIMPLGRTTTVSMTSAWPDPSFGGAFLPEKRSIGEKGFTASWKVLDLNRNYPQQWVGGIDASAVNGSRFGVALFSPVDEYTQANRAVKYTIMFVGLTFLLFFLVEVFNRRRIHPIQYLLVGLALCLFYLLLLSLSEHLGFAPAYLIASLSTIALITFYIAHALGGRVTTLATAAMLTALYGFLYILLQNQDYALLMGSIGLFVIMGAVMYLSRNIDWYAVEAKRAAGAVATETSPAGEPNPKPPIDA